MPTPLTKKSPNRAEAGQVSSPTAARPTPALSIEARPGRLGWEENDNSMRTRPWEANLLSAWSLLRGVAPFLSIVGQLRLMQAFGGGGETGFLGTWASLTLAHRVFLSLLAFQGAVFVVVSLGSMVGRRWAWYSLGWASLVLCLWNLRAWIPGGLGSLSLSLPIYSLIALLLSLWLLNRRRVRGYFSLAGEPPSWMQKKIRGRPALMVVGVGLLLVMVVLEVGGFLAYLTTLR